MEFWGVEVKAGEPLKVEPKDGGVLHLSQAALGESKKDKGNESVVLFVKYDNKKIVVGTLSQEKFPQLSFDLVFEKEFEISHNWKSGSVFLCGYQSPLPDDEEEYSDFDEDAEGLPFVNAENGKVDNAKPKVNAAAVPDAKAVLKKDNKSEDESDEDGESDDDDESGEDESGDEDDSEEGMSVDDDSEDDDDDESDSDDEETPKKAEPGKKRPNESAIKTPQPSKKAKSVTPQKTDGKKGGHTATPHPAKNAGKATANGNKPQTPKSGGQFSCNSCSKSFGSEGALQSHSKAKHSGK